MEQTKSSERGGAAPRKSLVVRDDRAGTLATRLGCEIDTAHRLLDDAEMLRDDIGFERWRDRFWAWRTGCGVMLQSCFEREAAEEFYGGTRMRDFPKSHWRDGSREAAKAVQDMIQLLTMLRHTLGRGS